jgi:cell filamentation protein
MPSATDRILSRQASREGARLDLMTDPYVYPGTRVLRNVENIHDAEELARFERLMTAQRLREGLPNVELSADGYRALHRHLFQDVYDWAGRDRIVEIAKGDSLFCLPQFIRPELDSLNSTSALPQSRRSVISIG